MQKAGEYRFVIQAYDNHAHLHKDHQVKPALELNAEWKTPKLLLAWAPMRQGQKFGDNPGNGKPNTAIGKRIFPDLPVPPDQLPPNEDREAYRKAKVIVHVWGEPNTTKTVYLRLLDPDDPSAPDTQEELPIDNNDGVIQDPSGGVTFVRRPNDNRREVEIVEEVVDGRRIRREVERFPSIGMFEGGGTDSQVDVNLNDEGYGRAEVIVLLSRQPGNNFKVAGAFDNSVRDGLHIKEGTQEEALRVWTADGKKVPEGNEPEIEPVARATELLTVWRRLWVEMDSMGAEHPDHQWDAEDDDLLRGDIVDLPFPGFLEEAFRKAYILPLKDTGNDEGNTYWIQYLYEGHTQHDIKLRDGRIIPKGAYYNQGVYGKWYRQTPEFNDYWAVYICAAYEEDPRWDNDPDGELANLGRTYDAELFYSHIWMEDLRDWARYCSWSEQQKEYCLKILIVHEIGHHFRLPHSPDFESVMSSISPNTPKHFNAQELAQIRSALMP